MKRQISFYSLLISMFCLLASVGCSKEPAGEEGGETSVNKGFYSVKDAVVEIDNIGGDCKVTFLSLGAWSVESDSDWCVLSTTEGAAGDAVLEFEVMPNPDDKEMRDAVIKISVEGYAQDVVLVDVHQSVDVEADRVNGDAANLWMTEYMTSNYLWYKSFADVKPHLNYWGDPTTFLNTALAKMKGINEDGNYYINGERYYYTSLTIYQKVQQAAGQTRAMTQKKGFGIDMVYPTILSQSNGTYAFLIASVADESPADNVGVERGMYITKYNGGDIKAQEYNDILSMLLGFTETTDTEVFTISGFKLNDNDQYELSEIGEFNITPSTYTSNPIVYSDIITENLDSHKVGYLVYSEFDYHADDLLITKFNQFKSNGVTDLVLDLRYNRGGDVYSAAVMASAIVKPEHKGKVLCEMAYNEYRTARGETNYFYVGENPSMNDYQPIVTAAENSLGLDRVYIITTSVTASASELMINGLRGLGLEVFVIGETTEGKNVGMEVISSDDSKYSKYDFGSYLYEFAPITFYNKNAQGFKDFADGFKPDFKYIETSSIMFDWDEYRDQSLIAALNHIKSGTWSGVTSAPSVATSTVEVELPKAESPKMLKRAASYVYPNREL